MNITQLRYVLEIAKSNSMREASTRLYVSQPALSASIRDLEEELGMILFDRNNKGISLTLEGREFLVYAQKALSQYELLEDRFLSKDKERERFSVSTQHFNFAIKAFTRVLAVYNPAKYTFSIHETRTSEVLTNVRDLKSEVGVLSYSNTNEEVIKRLVREYKLEFVPLMLKEAYVYVWENHELANRKEVSLSDLSDYPCVSFDQSDDNNYYLSEEAMSDYDFAKVIKSDDRATSMEIISELGGYSIGSGMLAEDDAILKGMVSVKLKEEDLLTIGYITRKGSQLSEYGKAYVEELLKYKTI